MGESVCVRVGSGIVRERIVNGRERESERERLGNGKGERERE